MNTSLFLLSVTLAIVAPIVAISYLRPILLKVLQSLCNAEGAAEFWLRSAYLLAVCGTLLLMLTFGQFNDDTSAVDTLRRALWLVLAGVFTTVGLIAQQVWRQVRELLGRQQPLEAATPFTRNTSRSDQGLGEPDGISWPK
jgi:EamA domain-containing membrane protein RarD